MKITKKMEINQVDIEAYQSLLNEYRKNTVFFVEHALGHKTWSKQREILRSVRDNEKTAVRACHGSSKTFTAAEIAVWFLNCFENSKVITTAPTFTQVAELLWAEINNIYRTSRVELEGECQTLKIKDPDNPTHYAIGFSTDKPARAEGWHAPSILFIFDEAKGLSQWIWDSIRGLMTGGFCRWLVISTTDGVELGENYYKIFEKEDNGWNKIHIKATDSPYITDEKFKYIDIPDLGRPDIFTRKEIKPGKLKIQIATQKYIDECEKEWGKDSVLFVTKVDGEIADVGADTIIKLSQANKMSENYNNPDFDDSGQEEIGVDVARGGADDTVFFKRKGLKVVDYRIITSKQLPPTEKLEYIADELEIFIGREKEIKIKVDDTGVGGGLTDIMQRRGYRIIPVNFQQEANEPDKYPNAISEMWFETSKIIHEIACEEISRLKKELVNRKYKPLDKKGRRVIESKEDYKKRGFVSPDLADSFLLTFYNPEKDNEPGDVFHQGIDKPKMSPRDRPETPEKTDIRKRLAPNASKVTRGDPPKKKGEPKPEKEEVIEDDDVGFVV